jgi:hypothetical protein
MASDFEDFEDECDFDDENDELTPEEIAEIKRGDQDVMMGFAYEMVDGEEGLAFKCGKCGRIASIREKPFPHKFDCPMKAYDEE